ncbi:hypothetical protein PENSPDRAFT_320101 [Peniophora sp. CONT]|nr:hypothetical protein PENSPDRAFT_320101 [Peniophora sp. CONT]
MVRKTLGLGLATWCGNGSRLPPGGPNGAEKYRASGLICALPTPPAYRFRYNRAFKVLSRPNQSCRVFGFASRPGSRSPKPFAVHPWCGKVSHFTTPRSPGAEKYRASRPHLCTMVRKRIEVQAIFGPNGAENGSRIVVGFRGSLRRSENIFSLSY